MLKLYEVFSIHFRVDLKIARKLFTANDDAESACEYERNNSRPNIQKLQQIDRRW